MSAWVLLIFLSGQQVKEITGFEYAEKCEAAKKAIEAAHFAKFSGLAYPTMVCIQKR